MPRIVYISTRFKRDVKRARKRGKDTEKLQRILDMLTDGEPLSAKYRDHLLSGNWKHHRECHIEPDWLLIYMISEASLRLIATGTHADLFDE